MGHLPGNWRGAVAVRSSGCCRVRTAGARLVRWECVAVGDGGISEQVAKSGLEVGTDSCSGLRKVFYFSAHFWAVLNDLILLV